MKKFLNTMLITAAVVAASTGAYAATAGKVAQGFYLGASAGAANTNVKYNMVTSGKMVKPETNVLDNTGAFGLNTKSNTGKMAGIFGLLAGYNFQSGSLVFGGEIYGGFDSTKVTVNDTTGSGSKEAAFSTTVKRTNFMGFAPRLGFMVAPNTLMYARLGVEFGKWKAQIAPDAASLSAARTEWNAAFPLPAGIADAQLAASQATISGSKGGMSFAPGLGMEVYMGKAFLRAQYSYLFGPKITLTQNIAGVSAYILNGETATHTFKMSQHKVELAVGYKF
jgi:hypothetical protein